MEYFNTFGGNPVSCAIANAVLSVIEDDQLISHAKQMGDYLIAEFKKLQEKHYIIGKSLLNNLHKICWFLYALN